MILLLVLFLSTFNIVYNLRCTNDCSMNYSINDSFYLPVNCSYITSNRCSVKLIFWFERDYYVVRFPGESINDGYNDDNRYFVMIEAAKNTFFSYEINHICRDTDDCARRFAETKINQMTQLLFNTTKIFSDLRRVLYRKIISTDDLLCFDTSETIRQCAVAGMLASCQITDDLSRHKLYQRSCQRLGQESTSVNIYDSGSHALITIKCNRILCNGPLTVTAVKNVLNHHNITDVHGRLLGFSVGVSLRFNFYKLLIVILLSWEFFC